MTKETDGKKPWLTKEDLEPLREGVEAVRDEIVDAAKTIKKGAQETATTIHNALAPPKVSEEKMRPIADVMKENMSSLKEDLEKAM